MKGILIKGSLYLGVDTRSYLFGLIKEKFWYVEFGIGSLFESSGSVYVYVPIYIESSLQAVTIQD